MATRLLLGALLCCGAAGAQPGAQAPQVPFAATMVGMSEDGRAVIVRVTHDGAKPATAWSFDTTFVYADGRRKKVNTARDIYSALASGSDEWPLVPGKTSDVRVGLTTSEVPLTVEIVPVAMVYMDRTAEGDPTSVDAIFTRRKDELDDLRDALSQLRDSMRQGFSRSRLTQLRDTLTSAPKNRSSIGTSLVVSNIQAALAQDGGDDVRLSRAVTHFLDIVARTYQLAAEHSVRR